MHFTATTINATAQDPCLVPHWLCHSEQLRRVTGRQQKAYYDKEHYEQCYLCKPGRTIDLKQGL